MRRFWLLLVLIVGALIAAVVMLRIDEVKVEGVHSLSARSIIEASGLEPGQRILWERLSVAERRIEEIPTVANVVAERHLPSTVVLRVFERAPIARLDGARQLAVDAEGVVFPVGEAIVEPVIYGWKATRVRAGARLDPNARTVLETIPRFPEELLRRVRKLHVGKTFTMTLLGNTEIRFGVLRDLEAKAVVAKAILDAERGKRLAYVDVRSPTVPVSRERPPPTPVPSPGPATPPPVVAATAPPAPAVPASPAP